MVRTTRRVGTSQTVTPTLFVLLATMRRPSGMNSATGPAPPQADEGRFPHSASPFRPTSQIFTARPPPAITRDPSGEKATPSIPPLISWAGSDSSSRGWRPPMVQTVAVPWPPPVTRRAESGLHATLASDPARAGSVNRSPPVPASQIRDMPSAALVVAMYRPSGLQDTCHRPSGFGAPLARSNWRSPVVRSNTLPCRSAPPTANRSATVTARCFPSGLRAVSAASSTCVRATRPVERSRTCTSPSPQAAATSEPSALNEGPNARLFPCRLARSR
jgi:hypothetical protein